MLLFPEEQRPVTERGRVAAMTPDWHKQVENFLVESDHLYPGIDHWFRNSVVPGLETGKRLCRAVVIGDQIAALAIAKVSASSSKLCTLRVRPEFQRLGLGERLLRSVLANLLEYDTRKVHFTISEEVFDKCGGFFAPYGFKLGHWRKGWYVRGMYEMAYWARESTIRDVLSNQMPLFRRDPVVVLSVRPQHAAQIAAGTKLVEFRRRFTNQIRQAPAIVYVTSPVQQFQLTASIADVQRDTPKNLWEKYGDHAGCDRETFNTYFRDTHEGVALPLVNVQRLSTPISFRSEMLQAFNYRPPQSYAVLDRHNPLVQTVLCSNG
ncbi:MAG TPA: hypothetical protein VK157_00690 [Phycisphaerales bacterium]|nr:hypothetical protein [Phycisphaerales bacterium]